MVKESTKTKIMILGTFHIRQTPDLLNVDLTSISSRERQTEINKVVEVIKEFNPTNIAVEIVKEEHGPLNEKYEQFLKGELMLEVNEVHQFGFRAAAALHHKQIYAVDWMGDGVNADLGSVLEWAKTKKPEIYQLINEYYAPKLALDAYDQNILKLIQACNAPSRIMLDHEMYLTIGRLQKGTEYIGMEWLCWWYQRNLIIYSNLAEITTSPSDRTLLIIGSAHVHLISQFLKVSGLFEVVPANEALRDGVAYE